MPRYDDDNKHLNLIKCSVSHIISYRVYSNFLLKTPHILQIFSLFFFFFKEEKRVTYSRCAKHHHRHQCKANKWPNNSTYFIHLLQGSMSNQSVQLSFCPSSGTGTTENMQSISRRTTAVSAAPHKALQWSLPSLSPLWGARRCNPPGCAAYLPILWTTQSCWQRGQRLFCFTHRDMQQLWKEWLHSPHTTETQRQSISGTYWKTIYNKLKTKHDSPIH